MTRVLALDVSLTCTGYALVDLPFRTEADGRHLPPFVLDAAGLPVAGEWTLDATLSLTVREGRLGAALEEVIDRWHPDAIVGEVPQHTFNPGAGGASKTNSRSAAMQQRAFGVVGFVCHHCGVPYIELDPKHSKRAITGDANAGKPEVAAHLARLFGVARRESAARGSKAALVAGHAGRLAPVRWDWPPGLSKESVRDALAVAFWIDYRMRVYGSRWLDESLAEDKLPPPEEWADRRPQSPPTHHLTT